MTESTPDDQLGLFAEDQRAATVPLLTPDEEDRLHQLQRLGPDERIAGLLNVSQLQTQLAHGATIGYKPSRPCPRCGGVDAVVRQTGTQLPVTCTRCNRVSYNAPKSELGLVERSVKTLRDDISPSQQARILNRDHGRCIFCGSRDDLTMGHLLSVRDGFRLGATREELFDDANLAAMCEGCNAGLSSQSVSLSTYVIMCYILRSDRLHAFSNSPAAGALKRKVEMNRVESGR
jgi:5-methylcytosine-specific restriction endonuclease McrA